MDGRDETKNATEATVASWRTTRALYADGKAQRFRLVGEKWVLIDESSQLDEDIASFELPMRLNLTLRNGP